MQIKSLILLAFATLATANGLYERDALPDIGDLELDLHPRDVYAAKVVARDVYHQELVARAKGKGKTPPRKGGGGRGGGETTCVACGAVCSGSHYHPGQGMSYDCV